MTAPGKLPSGDALRAAKAAAESKQHAHDLHRRLYAKDSDLMSPSELEAASRARREETRERHPEWFA